MTMTFAAVAPQIEAAGTLKLTLSPLDLTLIVIYFVFVIGIGFALRRLITTSTDFFLSGRSLPAWITGIAFISANLGAIEILGMSASGAQYGISIVHYYWIGAVPAMVFLGIVMMPFYYGSRVRSVPEYLLRRYDDKTHLVNAIIFVLASVLIAGVNLYALSAVLQALLGIPLAVAIVVSALFVLSYILLGGLSSAIYNEVMQFFVILAGLVPVVIIALKETGGIGGLFAKLSTNGHDFTSAWAGVGLGGHNPIGDWISLVFGLSFCLSFGYWTTNFAEVQRAMSAKDDNSARLTPIIGAYPKALIPLGIVIPGMAAVLLIPGLGEGGGLPVQLRDPGADEQVPADRRPRRRDHRPARRVHGGHGGERLLLQRGMDLRHLADLHPARPPGQLLPAGRPLSPRWRACSSASSPPSSRRDTATSPTTSRRCSRSSTCPSSSPSSWAWYGARRDAVPGSGA